MSDWSTNAKQCIDGHGNESVTKFHGPKKQRPPHQPPPPLPAHTHTHTRARARTHAHAHTHAHTRTHTHTNTHTHTRTHTHTHARTHTQTHTHTHKVDKAAITTLCRCTHAGRQVGRQEGRKWRREEEREEWVQLAKRWDRHASIAGDTGWEGQRQLQRTMS